MFVAGTPVSFYPAPVDEIILAVGFKMNINIAREHIRTLGTEQGEERFGDPTLSAVPPHRDVQPSCSPLVKKNGKWRLARR